MTESTYDESIAALADRNYVVYAPRSAKELKKEYKELEGVPEFASLSAPEQLFVWWYACKSSPVYDIAEEKRVDVAIDKSWTNPQQQAARRIEYGNRDFPANIKAAIRFMEGINTGVRIRAAHADNYLLEQCERAIYQKVTGNDPEEMESYLKNATLAQKLIDSIQKKNEQGGRGVEETKKTTLENLAGVSASAMKNMT